MLIYNYLIHDMETLKVFQESIDIENAEVVDLYNTAKVKTTKCV